MTDYSSLEYWENRYNEHQEIFEWYQVYDNLKEKIGDLIKLEDKILYIGSGTSKLAEDLYLQEIKDVTNIDFSQAAITIMEERYKAQNIEMKCINTTLLHIDIKMNVTDMSPFQNEQFTVIIDKATLDSVLCGENALPVVEKMMQEIYRVLTPGGIFICVSNAEEQNRRPLFSEAQWDYSVLSIEKKLVIDAEEEKDTKNYHKIYILTKKSDSNK